MKATTALLLTLAATAFGSFSATAQYYYNDLLAPRQAVLQQQALAQAGIRRVVASSSEGDGSPSEGFALTQKVGKQAESIETESASQGTAPGTSLSRFANGQQVFSRDSSGNVGTATTYSYDAQGRLASLRIESHDAFMSSHSVETHDWTYKPDGQPQQMLRVKDGRDTTYVVFDYDAQGRPSAEQWRKGRRVAQTYYYYYNENSQLSDIVTYNLRARQLVPELLFQYRPDGRLSQMTQAVLGTGNYLVWTYRYDARNLKTEELCHSKGERLLGTVRYQYN